MKNYIQKGATKTYTHTAAVESGQPIAIGERAGVACGAYGANEEGEYLQGGVHEFKKKAALAILPGVTYDYDADAGEVVPSGDAESDFELGEGHIAADGADATCQILVNKMPYALS